MRNKTLRTRRHALRWATKGAAVALVATTCTSIAASGPATSAPRAKQISVGVVIDRTGPAPENNIWQGVIGYFRWLDAHGGVNGYKVKVLGYDDGANPATNAAQVLQMIQQGHVSAIISDDGVAGGPAGFPIAEAAGVPMVAGNVWPQVYQNGDLFPNAPYHTIDSGVMTAQVFKAAGIKKVAIATLNVPVAIASEVSDVQQIQASGMQVATNLLFPASQTDFTEFASKIVQSGADALMPVCPQSRALALLAALQQQGWSGKLVYFPSVQAGLGASLGSFGYNRVISPQGDIPVQKHSVPAYFKAMKQYWGLTGRNAITQNQTAGWNEGEIVAHAIQLLGNKAPTAANMKAALESFKNWSADFSAPLTYGKGPHANPAHCAQMLEDVNGNFVPYHNQYETCWTVSVAPPAS